MEILSCDEDLCDTLVGAMERHEMSNQSFAEGAGKEQGRMAPPLPSPDIRYVFARKSLWGTRFEVRKMTEKERASLGA